MASDTNLTRELAIKLIRSQVVVCPKCGQSVLHPRYTYKNQNVEYRAPPAAKSTTPAGSFD